MGIAIDKPALHWGPETDRVFVTETARGLDLVFTADALRGDDHDLEEYDAAFNRAGAGDDGRLEAEFNAWRERTHYGIGGDPHDTI